MNAPSSGAGGSPYVTGGQRTYSYHAPSQGGSYQHSLHLHSDRSTYTTSTTSSSSYTTTSRPQLTSFTQRYPQLPPSLHCDEEKLDGRQSPDLWPEPVPGALELGRQNTVLVPTQKTTQRFNTQLDPDDVRLVNDLGRLSANQLFEYVSTLQNNALLLGVDEKRQFERGRLLQIFPKRPNGALQ